jgi:hypothetical protein
MQVYFFHLRRRGKLILDPDGTSLASSDEARRVAVLEARELIVTILKTEGRVPLEDGIDIADEHGAVLDTVTFKEALS